MTKLVVSVMTLSRMDFQLTHLHLVVSIVDLMLDLDLMIHSEVASLAETMRLHHQVAIHLEINAELSKQSHRMYLFVLIEF